MDWVASNAGTLINAAAFVFVVLLVTLFGLRPMVSALTGAPGGAEGAAADAGRALENRAGQQGQLPASAGADGEDEEAGASAFATEKADDFQKKLKPAPQERLARMVDLSEERTAHILRKWANPDLEAEAG